MPSPKDIKNILKATQGTKAAGKAVDLEELLGRLPKGSKAQQLETELMFQRLKEERDALYPKPAPATETGKAALAAAKKTLSRDQAPAEVKQKPNKKKQFIENVYNKYPEHPFNSNQRVISEGAGDEQKFAQFELKPGFGKDEVEIDWISAYPQRSGMGTKAIKALQQEAQDAGITLTLFPWDKGNVSQRALTKFYKGLGFQPAGGRSRSLMWKPEPVEAAAETAAEVAPAVQAPSVIIPSKVSNVEQAVRESKGEYGAKRVQRAADQIKNLEDQYTEEALRRAFVGDNATAVMIGDPAKFKDFAAELNDPYRVAIENYWRTLSPGGGGAEDVPFLQLNQEGRRLPFISGHEGRHRNIAMEELGYPSTLWRLMPRAALREDFPRRSQEEYIDALIKHLDTNSPLVIPEGRFMSKEGDPKDWKRDWTKALNLPEIFAEGGAVQHLQVGGIPKALKTISNVGKAEKSMEAARNLMQANRPLSLAERQFVAEVAARNAEELASLRPQEIASVEAKKSRGPSPKPARAKPKTKAEINAIAERVAPQMLGEFVRQPGKTKNVAGKTRKQFDLEQELQHEMQRSRDVPDVATVDLEPHVGSVMLSLPGDTSISDYDIFSIGGNRLREPARQYGGPRFGLGHPEEAGWASGLDQAAGFQRRVNAASQQYGDVPVLANYLAMGPEGLNYATHFTDTLLKGIDPTKMSKKDIEAFNRMMRYGKNGVHMPDFPGIENPEAAYLYLANNPVGRKLIFNPTMQLTDTMEGLGLPSGLNVRHAITEPELRDIEPGMTGFSLLQMEPGVMGLKPSAHPTYSHDIPGKFLGRTDVLMPYELTFPDTVAGIRANPKQAGNEFGTLQMLGGKQIIDQQLLDEIGEYRRRIKQLTGKKDGGVVHMAGGNEPGQSIGEMFKPKPLTIPEPLTEIADAIKRQFRKEKGSMSKPGALTDVLMRGPVAFAAGAPMDIIGMGGDILDWAQTKIPGLRERSVMDQPTSVVDKRPPVLGYQPKFKIGPQDHMPYGSAYAQELMNKSGLTTGEERPLFELGSAIVAPGATAKALKYGKAGAKALAPTATELLETQLERATAPMRMSIVPEDGAKLSKEEYSRMMREKYAAQNAAKEQKTATASGIKREEVKVPADNLGLYSPGQKAAANLQRNIGTGEAFLSDLRKAPDVGEADLLHAGLEDWLRNKKTVTKQEIQDYMADNRLKLRQHELSGEGASDDMRFGRPEVVDDYDYINSTAEDYVNFWDNHGYKPRSEIRQEILESHADDPEYVEHLLNSGKIDDLVEEEVSSLATELAQDAYYDNPYREWTNDAGYSIIGNDDVGYSVRSPNGTVINQREIYDIETAQGVAQQHGIDNGYGAAGSTQYSGYQLPGPSSNYREHLTQIDKSVKRELQERQLNELTRQINYTTDPAELEKLTDQYNRLKDEVYEIYSGAHHDVEDIMSHSRTQDRVDIDGNNVLHVDELQSDMHQDGSEFGYKTPETRKRYKDLMNQRQSLATEFAAARGEILEIANADLNILPTLKKEFDAATKRADDLARNIDKINNELSDIEKAVPDAPFKKDWAEKEFKKLLNLAAKEGKDRITLSRWQDQLERWGTDSLAFRKTKTGEWVISGTRNRRLSDLDMNDTITPKDVAEIVFAREGEYDCNSIEGLRDFIKINVGRGWSNAHLDRVTNKAWDQMQKLNPGEMGAIDPRKDGFKSTYGKSYIDMMQKLARKYGGKTGVTKIDKGGFDLVDVPYIELSGNLKKSSIKGLPYKNGGAVRMAEGGAVDYEARFNQMLQDHVGMAEGGAVDYESRFNDMLQKHVQGLAEGGEVENEYNSDPDMSDGGRFVQAPAFANGGAVKSIWTVN